MQNSWNALQRQVQQLDAKVRLLTSSTHASLPSASGDVEIISEQFSPDALSPHDYFGVLPGPKADTRNAKSRNSSAGSKAPTVSASSFPTPATHQSSGTLSPEMVPHSLRRRPSRLSDSPATTSRVETSRPPWNASPKPSPDPHQTSNTERFPSYGSQYSRGVSPTPSSPSTTSSIASRPNAVGSRIPVISPKKKSVAAATHRYVDVPGLSVSISHSQTFLSEASTSTHNRNHLNHASEMPKTPEPRSSLPRTVSSAHQLRSIMTPTAGYRSFSLGNAPQTAPNFAKSSYRAPPSSFRARTPTPGGASTRPSSRLSMGSYSNFDSSYLQPFQPSKYDLLDQHVRAIVEEIAFDLFVGRVDPPLRKGQSQKDDEEWKGVYVFGAGEKPLGVKLLKLAGRSGPSGSEKPRTKCLVRVGGAWQDLTGLLKKRKADAPQQILDSP